MENLLSFEDFVNESKELLEFTTLQNAIEKFKEQFDDWAFDERDSGDDLEYYVEKELGRKMNAVEKKDSEYKKAVKQCNKISDAASYIGYQNRIGDKVDQAKAEKEFQKELNKI